MSKQADANYVIEQLSTQVAQLIAENAMLSSIVQQYQSDEGSEE